MASLRASVTRRSARRGRAWVALSLLVATATLGAAAFAQTKGKPGPAARPKPKAPDADAPAAVEDPGTPIPGSQAPAGASSLDGGPIPAPPVRVDLGDGGVKLSPLNPMAPEMPPTTPAPAASA